MGEFPEENIDREKVGKIREQLAELTNYTVQFYHNVDDYSPDLHKAMFLLHRHIDKAKRQADRALRQLDEETP